MGRFIFVCRLSSDGELCTADECALLDWLCDVAVLWMDARSELRDGGGGAERRGTYGATRLLDDDAAETVGRMMGEFGDEPDPEATRDAGNAAGGGERTVVLTLGRSGSLGGTDFRGVGARSHARLISRSVLGLAMEGAETSSYDSERLIVSESPILRAGGGEVCRASMGNVAMWFDTDPGVLGSYSSDSETEWNEETEDDGAWFDMFFASGSESPASGGYLWACSTVNESVRREMEGAAADLRVVYEGLRGGSCGGSCGAALSAVVRLVGLGLGCGLGGESKLMSGVPLGERAVVKPCWVGVFESARPFADGWGPSSTTQSLRSMRDVLRPRLGGEGDGDGRVTTATGLSGAAVIGESGVSRMSEAALE